jgi:hypothetical protein
VEIDFGIFGVVTGTGGRGCSSKGLYQIKVSYPCEKIGCKNHLFIFPNKDILKQGFKVSAYC